MQGGLVCLGEMTESAAIWMALVLECDDLRYVLIRVTSMMAQLGKQGMTKKTRIR